MVNKVAYIFCYWPTFTHDGCFVVHYCKLNGSCVPRFGAHCLGATLPLQSHLHFLHWQTLLITPKKSWGDPHQHLLVLEAQDQTHTIISHTHFQGDIVITYSWNETHTHHDSLGHFLEHFPIEYFQSGLTKNCKPFQCPNNVLQFVAHICSILNNLISTNPMLFICKVNFKRNKKIGFWRLISSVKPFRFPR